MKIRTVQLATLGVLFAACGSALGAETVRATFNSVSPSVGCEFSIDFGGTWTGTLAGGMNWTRDGMNPGTYAGLQGDFRTFCIEVTQQVGFGNSYEYFVVDPSDAPTFEPMGAFRASELSELFGRYYGSLVTNSDFGAFQMAIWEVVYEIGETPLNVNDGRFQIRNAAVEQNMANAMLASLNGTGPMMSLVALTNREYQDQIVPAPASLALAGLGGLIGLRRRRSR